MLTPRIDDNGCDRMFEQLAGRREKSWKIPGRVVMDSEGSERERESSIYQEASSTRFECSITGSSRNEMNRKNTVPGRDNAENLKRKYKKMIDPLEAEDKFFDQCVDRCIYQSYSSRNRSRRKVQSKPKRPQNLSLNSNTYANYCMDAKSTCNASATLGSTDPFNYRRNARLPQLSRIAIASQTSSDQMTHSKLVKMIYRNHPRELFKSEADEPSMTIDKTLLKSTQRKGSLLITEYSGKVKHFIDPLLLETQTTSIFRTTPVNRPNWYQYPNKLTINNQPFNEYFDQEVNGRILRFSIKKVRESFQQYIALRDDQNRHRDQILDLEHKLKDSIYKAKKARHQAMRKRLLATAAIRLAMLTEAGIRHVAGWHLIRHLKDTVREDWEWYYLKVPYYEIELCSWSPSYEELVELKIIDLTKNAYFNEEEAEEKKGKLIGKDGLHRREAFNGTADPSSNPFAKRIWNPRTRRFSKVMKDAPIAFKIGDPTSTVITKIMKEGEYSSYWLQCIDKCLEFEDTFDINHAGYISTLKEKTSKLVLKEFRSYLYQFTNVDHILRMDFWHLIHKRLKI